MLEMRLPLIIIDEYPSLFQVQEESDVLLADAQDSLHEMVCLWPFQIPGESYIEFPLWFDIYILPFPACTIIEIIIQSSANCRKT